MLQILLMPQQINYLLKTTKRSRTISLARLRERVKKWLSGMTMSVELKKSILRKQMPINQTKMHLTEKKYLKRGKITNIFCRKCKLKYQRDRCLNMDEIRHNNPK